MNEVIHRHKDCVVAEFKDSTGGPAHTDHSHGSMVFDGRDKSVVYHGHRIGELYDLENDPGEFDNLWDDPAARERKAERIRAHLDAMMATVSAGPPRSGAYQAAAYASVRDDFRFADHLAPAREVAAQQGGKLFR